MLAPGSSAPTGEEKGGYRTKPPRALGGFRPWQSPVYGQGYLECLPGKEAGHPHVYVCGARRSSPEGRSARQDKTGQGTVDVSAISPVPRARAGPGRRVPSVSGSKGRFLSAVEAQCIVSRGLLGGKPRGQFGPVISCGQKTAKPASSPSRFGLPTGTGRCKPCHAVPVTVGTLACLFASTLTKWLCPPAHVRPEFSVFADFGEGILDDPATGTACPQTLSSSPCRQALIARPAYNRWAGEDTDEARSSSA